MEGDGRVRIVAQIELVEPTEFEARLAYRVIAVDGMRVVFGDVGCMAGDLIGDHALFDIILVRQAEVLLRRHIAQHGGAVTGDLHTADCRGDVVVAGGGVGRERAQRIERGILANRLLHFDVHAYGVERNVSRAFDHHLHVMLPCSLGELAQGHELRELRRVVGIRQ